MKTNVTIILLIALAVCNFATAFPGPQTGKQDFPIYDSMFYKGKPDTKPDGLIASNILYEKKIWPNRQNAGTLPNQEEFKALVRATIPDPGPLVIDIESLPLRGTPEAARHNTEILSKLADWAHEAAPGKVVGYNGTNTLSNVPPPNQAFAKELASHVDAFFPSLYTFDDNREGWEKRAQAAQAEARALDTKKPIYFFLWPQYHQGTARALRYLNSDYWKFELETARRYSNGIVLWGPSGYFWDAKSGWWAATQEFAKSLH
ncbi:MAG: hypothetical protein WBL63_24650 [Candidatus Acidiferrum sp.]